LAHNRVSRFTATGDTAAPGSEAVILELNNLSSATNHNGGAIHFGPDGKLYIGVGENANRANSQTLSNLLGKMLRINADGTIPPDNPFYNTATGNNRAIWALGLRNPFTFAFQPGTTRLFINDVGESTYEEINDGIAGSNYGWPTTEGPTSNPSFRSPIYFYGHGTSNTTGCAIVGALSIIRQLLNSLPPIAASIFLPICAAAGSVSSIPPPAARLASRPVSLAPLIPMLDLTARSIISFGRGRFSGSVLYRRKR
jgi:hypothetical protein